MNVKMQKHILLLADMEGCSGITDMGQYDICQERMIEETERVIRLIETYEKAEISVADCHNDGKNIVKYFSEKGYVCYEHIWFVQSVERYDCAMLIGFHPKNGEDGFCPHTIRPDVKDLYLGEKSIGEVGLMINWLAGHGVPVVFVSGDSAVKKELDGYDGEFYATNEKESDDLDRQTLMELMKPYIQRALGIKDRDILHYNDHEIRLRLIGEVYNKFVPQELFLVREGFIVFPNTESFILSLLPLCEFLNIAEEYQRLRIRHLVKKIKKSGVRVEKDRRANDLLNQKEWRALSDEEISYLYKVSQSGQDEVR